MINKYLILTLLLILMPGMAWGQEPIDLSSDTYKDGYTISTGGTYTFTGKYSGTPTQDIDGTRKAVIKVGTKADVTIVLDGVKIELTGEFQCPLSAKDGKKVTVQLKGENFLSTTNDVGQSPGLWVPESSGGELIIEDADESEINSLAVQGAPAWPGIGMQQGKGSDCKITIKSGCVKTKGGSAGIGASGGKGGYKGTITISGGMVEAMGGESSAGIGGGQEGSGGTIVISGGMVTATGGIGGAGIGGGSSGSGGTITISGGIVEATGGNLGAGIGGSFWGSGGNITISGGTVTAKGTGKEPAPGIGKGYYADDNGSFSTGTNGSAIIFASSISDQRGKNNSSWKGIISENNNTGQIYGSSLTLTTDQVIPSGKTVNVNNGQELIVSAGKTLVNQGTITNNGTIMNNGTVSNQGKISGNPIQHAVTYNSNYDTPSTVSKYIAENSIPDYTSFTQQYYFIEGWYDAAIEGNKVEKITKPITVYAHWAPNALTVSTPSKQDLTYKQASYSYDLSTLSPGASDKCGAITYALSSGSFPDGLSVNQAGIISGTPVAATAAGVTVIIKATAANTSYQDIEVSFSVAKRNVTVIPIDNQVIHKDAAIAYTVENIAGGDAELFDGSLKVENGKVVQGSGFKLKDAFAANYISTFRSGVDITVQYPLTLIIKKDGEDWSDHNKTFTVKMDNNGSDITGSDNKFYLANGSYTVYEGGVETNKTFTETDGILTDFAVDYYTITYNLNGGTDNCPNATTHLSGTNIPVDAATTPKRDYYTFKGWGVTAGATSSDKVETITGIGEPKTLYAIWELNKFTADPLPKQELTYKEASYSYDLSALSPGAAADCGTITYVLCSGSFPADLSVSEAGIISGIPTALTTEDATVTIKATAANTSSQDIEVTFSVGKGTVTVTPNDNQILYKGEKVAYTFTGNAADETPDFSGQLSVENEKIAKGTLALEDNGLFLASNYNLVVKDVAYTYIDMKPEDATATLPVSSSSGWYTATVTFTAPEGFEIQKTGVILRSSSSTSFTFGEEGSHTVTYELSRNGKDYKHTADIDLDLANPVVSVAPNKLNYTLTATDGKGSGIATVKIDGVEVALTGNSYTSSGTAGSHTFEVTDQVGKTTKGSFVLTDPTPIPDPAPITYYSVTLPAVEGAILNPAPGEYICEAGELFTFSLVLDPDYDQSVPVVRADGEELKPNYRGQYSVRVWSNVRISIEGIQANAPSALETPSDGQSRIYTAGSILCIETAQPQQLTVLTLGGRLQRTLQVTEGLSHLRDLPHGFYIVRLEDGTTEKVGIGGK